jgi:hypothetical protein
MTYDPLDRRIADTLRAIADGVPVRDRLVELRVEPPGSNARTWRFSSLPALAGVATFVVGLAVVGGVLFMLRHSTNAPTATTMSTANSTTVPASSTSSTALSDAALESIHGTWSLVSFSVVGEMHLVEVGTNSAELPWAEFDAAGIHGSLGCNDFSGPGQPVVADGMLKLGVVVADEALCLSPDGSASLMAVENVFGAVIHAEPGTIAIQVDGSEMIWSARDATLTFAREETVPVTTATDVTTYTYVPAEPLLDIRTPSGLPGDELIICGTFDPFTEMRVVFGDPVTGEAWPDEIDEFTKTDANGHWCWTGVFPGQLEDTDPRGNGQLRPITPGAYEIRLESFGNNIARGTVEILPGYSEDTGWSQTPEEAKRDGVVAGLAALPVERRVHARSYQNSSEGVWVLSTPDIYDELTGSCDPEDSACVLGRDWIYGGEYGELLLMDRTGREILRAYPMPGLVPGWLYLGDDYLYAGHIGDGAYPQNSLVRVDRHTLEMEGLIFEEPDNEYAWFAGAIAAGEWLDGWQVITDERVATPFLVIGQNIIHGVPAPSWIGEVYIDLDAIESLFDQVGTGS